MYIIKVWKKKLATRVCKGRAGSKGKKKKRTRHAGSSVTLEYSDHEHSIWQSKEEKFLLYGMIVKLYWLQPSLSGGRGPARFRPSWLIPLALSFHGRILQCYQLWLSCQVSWLQGHQIWLVRRL